MTDLYRAPAPGQIWRRAQPTDGHQWREYQHARICRACGQLEHWHWHPDGTLPAGWYADARTGWIPGPCRRA